MDEIKDCPFCGDDEVAPYHYMVSTDLPALSTRYGIYCNGCDKYIVSDWKTEAMAIKAWNKRA